MFVLPFRDLTEIFYDSDTDCIFIKQDEFSVTLCLHDIPVVIEALIAEAEKAKKP